MLLWAAPVLAQTGWSGAAKGKFSGTVRSEAKIGRFGSESPHESTQEQFIRRSGNKLTVTTRIRDAFGPGRHSTQTTVGEIESTHVDANDRSTVLKVKFGGELNRRLAEGAIKRSFGGAGGMEVRAVKGESLFRFRTDGTVSVDSKSSLERGKIERGSLLKNLIANGTTGGTLSETGHGELKPVR